MDKKILMYGIVMLFLVSTVSGLSSSNPNPSDGATGLDDSVSLSVDVAGVTSFLMDTESQITSASFNDVRDIVVDGNYIYFVSMNEDKLYSYDISNPSSPSFQDSYSSGSPYDIENAQQIVKGGSGELFVVSEYNGVASFSISSGNINFEDVNAIGSGDQIYGADYFNTNHEAIILVEDGSSTSIRTMDVDSISNIQYADVYNVADAEDVKVLGNYAYVVTPSDLEKLDVSDIYSISQEISIHSFDFEGLISIEIDAGDEVAYLADQINHEIFAYDISSELSLSSRLDSISHMNIDGYIDMSIYGNYLFVLGDTSVLVFDISDSSNIQFIEEYTSISSAYRLGIASDNENLYTALGQNDQVDIISYSGSNSAQACFHDASDSSQIGCSSTTGGTVSQTWNGLSFGNSYDWYVELDDGVNTDTSTTWTFDTNNAPNSPTNPSPTGTITTTSPTLSIDVTDSDGDSMDICFYDASDDSLIGCDNSVASGGTATETWSGLSSGSNYNWYAVIQDSYTSTTSSTYSFSINSAPDQPSNPSPADTTTGLPSTVDLSVDVTDPEGSAMDVCFYNASDDSLIDCDNNTASGTRATVSWANLSYGTTYNWYATAEDEYTSTQSDTWSFSTFENNLSIIGNITGPVEMMHAIDLKDDYAFVVGMNSKSVASFDISDPTNIVTLDHYISNNMTGVRDIVVDGNYAYVTSYISDSLTILDISDPSNIIEISSYSSTDMDYARALYKDGNYVYVASRTSNSLTIIDVSDPSNPTQTGTVSSLDMDGARGVFKSGNYAYVVATRANSITSIDVSNPTTPTIIDTVTSTDMEGARDIKIDGNYAYVTSETSDSVTIIDVSSPLNMGQVGTVSDSTDMQGAYSLDKEGDYAFVASIASDTMNIVDVSDETSPSIINSLTDSRLDGAVDVIKRNEYLYVTSYISNTLSILLVSNIGYPNTPFNPEPSNGAGQVVLSPYLRVDVTDPDNDSMDVCFYNATDNALIGCDNGVASGGTASVQWLNLSEGSNHNWYATADDGSYITTSSSWGFTTQTESSTSDEPYIYINNNNKLQKIDYAGNVIWENTYGSRIFDGAYSKMGMLYIAEENNARLSRYDYRGTGYNSISFSDNLTNRGLSINNYNSVESEIPLIHSYENNFKKIDRGLNTPFDYGDTYGGGESFIFPNNEYAVINASTNVTYLNDAGPVWSTSITDNVTALEGSDDYLFVGYVNGTVHALNRTDGSIGWTATSTSDAITALEYHDNLYIGNMDGFIYMRDASTGSLITTLGGLTPISGMEFYNNGYLYVMDTTGDLKKYNAALDTELYSQATDYNPSSYKGLFMLGEPDFVNHTVFDDFNYDNIQLGTFEDENELNEPTSVVTDDDYAYVAAQDSLTIVDISTPSDPVQVSVFQSVEGLGKMFGIDKDGDYAYVTSYLSDSLTIIDVSDPANPTQTGTISNTDLEGAIGVFKSGNYAYVTARNSDSLTIIDVSDPTNPTQTGTISNDDLRGAWGVFKDGNYAYVTSRISDSLTIIDVSDPSNPTQTGTISTGDLNGAWSVFKDGNYAYVTSYYSGSLTIIDVSDLANPTQTGTITTADLNGARSVSKSGNYAYVAAEGANSLVAIDVSTPSNPTQEGIISDSLFKNPIGFDLDGDYAYVTARYSDSLTIIDVSDPTNPTQTGTITTADLNGARGVFKDGNHAYVTSQDADSLTIIDISDPANPTQTGTISNTDLEGAIGVFKSGNYAYVASYDSDSLTIIDVSDPANPTQTGTISNNNLEGARDIKIDGDYAYVASMISDSLTIIDVSDPANPTQTGTISNTDLNGAWSVFKDGNYAYVASISADSLTIIDISDPANPTQTGTISNTDLEGAIGVFKSGNYAYVASYYSDSLTIIDVSDPANPTQTGTISNSDLGQARNVIKEGEIAYVTAQGSEKLVTLNLSQMNNWVIESPSWSDAFNFRDDRVYHEGSYTIKNEIVKNLDSEGLGKPTRIDFRVFLGDQSVSLPYVNGSIVDEDNEVVLGFSTQDMRVRATNNTGQSDYLTPASPDLKYTYKTISLRNINYYNGTFDLYTEAKYNGTFNFNNSQEPEAVKLRVNTKDPITDSPYTEEILIQAGTLPNHPTDPLPVPQSTGISTSPQLSVNVTDPENSTMNVCFYDASDDSLIECDNNVASGDRASIIWAGVPPERNSWYVEVIKGIDKITSTTYSFVSNQDPVLLDFTPTDGQIGLGTTTTLSARYTDVEGDDSDVCFYDASDDSVLTCFIDVADNTTLSYEWAGLTKGEEYEWYMTVDHDYGFYYTATRNFFVNAEPVISAPQPANNSISGDIDTDLSVLVNDSDGGTVDVCFYDATDDSLLGCQNDKPANTRISQTWFGLTLAEEYSWYATANDSINMVTSPDWNFTIRDVPYYTNATLNNEIFNDRNYIYVEVNTTAATVDTSYIYLMDEDENIIDIYSSTSGILANNFTGLAEDNYLFYAKVNFVEGFEYELDTYSQKIDLTKPLIDRLLPTDPDNLYNNTAIEFKYEIQDRNFYGYNLTCYDSAENSVFSSQQTDYDVERINISHNIWLTDPGTYNCTIIASDDHTDQNISFDVSKNRGLFGMGEERININNDIEIRRNSDNIAEIDYIIENDRIKPALRIDNESVTTDTINFSYSIEYDGEAKQRNSNYTGHYVIETDDLRKSYWIDAESNFDNKTITSYIEDSTLYYNIETTREEVESNNYIYITESIGGLNFAEDETNVSISPGSLIDVSGYNTVNESEVDINFTVDNGTDVRTYNSSQEVYIGIEPTTIRIDADNHINTQEYFFTGSGAEDISAPFWQAVLTIEVRNAVSNNLVPSTLIQLEQLPYINITESATGKETYYLNEDNYNMIIENTDYSSLTDTVDVDYGDDKTEIFYLQPIYNVDVIREETGEPFSFLEAENITQCVNGTTQELRTETQEDADEYTCSGEWSFDHPCADAYDGLYDTYGQANVSEVTNLYMNYSKPSEALNSSRWTFRKDFINYDSFNMSNYPSCWAEDTLQFRIKSNESEGSATFYCNNGSSWQDMDTFYNEGRIYEEAMEWSYYEDVDNVTTCAENIDMQITVKTFCDDNVITNVLTRDDPDITGIDCNYKYWFIRAEYSDTSYYRTLVPDKDSFDNDIFMLDLNKDEAVQINLNIRDLSSEFTEGRIRLYKYVAGTREIVLEQYLDIEDRVVLWLDKDEVYEVYTINDDGDETYIGDLTADQATNKYLTMPYVFMGTAGYYEDLSYYYTSVNKSDGKISLYYTDNSTGGINSVKWEIFEEQTGMTVYSETSTTQNGLLTATGLDEHKTYWANIVIDHEDYGEVTDYRVLWRDGATVFEGWGETDEDGNNPTSQKIKAIIAFIVPIMFLLIFSKSSAEIGMTISLVIISIFQGLGWYEFITNSLPGGNYSMVVLIGFYGIFTFWMWTRSSRRNE